MSQLMKDYFSKHGQRPSGWSLWGLPMVKACQRMDPQCEIRFLLTVLNSLRYLSVLFSMLIHPCWFRSQTRWTNLNDDPLIPENWSNEQPPYTAFLFHFCSLKLSFWMSDFTHWTEEMTIETPPFQCLKRITLVCRERFQIDPNHMSWSSQ
jgi:hypothetical protein